jgi:hypothetical protein
MQDGQVGWDLISVYRHMSREEKIFVLYLVLVLVFSLLRSWKLARELWFFSRERRGSSHQPNLGAADLLATRAMANKIARAKHLADESPETYLQIVEGARPRFDYLGEHSAAKIVGMRDLSILTLILSGLVSSYDLMKVIAIWPIPSCGDCSGGPAELLVPFVLGLAVSSVLYVVSNLFAGTLAQRRAEWNLFVANVNSQHKNE